MYRILMFDIISPLWWKSCSWKDCKLCVYTIKIESTQLIGKSKVVVTQHYPNGAKIIDSIKGTGIVMRVYVICVSIQ